MYSANNRESWSRKSDCVTLGELEDDVITYQTKKNLKILSLHFLPTLQSAVG